MVYVQLAQDWTDDEGNTHSAGDTVDVDAGTLARLQSKGLVADPDEGEADPDSWIGPSGGGGDTDSWIGPSGGGGDTDSWIGPSGGGGDR
jgi:hypothetical protein